MIATVWTTAAELPFDPSFRTVLEPNVLETQMITTVLITGQQLQSDISHVSWCLLSFFFFGGPVCSPR
jgi:hypothetical protein